MDPGNPSIGGSAGGSSAPASEQFVICSSIRPGLKRELAFALKSQTELSATLGRSRLRKLPSSPFPATPPSSFPPPVKKRARNSLSEPFSVDAATLQTCSAPVPSAILKTFSTPALAPQNSSAEVRPGFAAETPIVIDDVDTVGPSTGSLAGSREAKPDHVSGNAGGVDVPGWLEQQVSRIAYAGSKYVMHATDGGSSNGGKSNGDSSDANRISRLSSPESVLDSIESTSRDIPSSERTGGKLTRKNLKLHKIVFMEDVLPEGTLLRYVVHGSPKLIGYAKDSGIYCTCCKEVISPSQFEAHAGQAQRRKPYNYIYTSNGVSLHELSVMLLKRRKFSDSENDDLCSICKDAGELVLCDLCPRAFHQACVGLLSIPEGDWHCQYCETMHQRENYVSRNDNARAAGRVPGVDAIDQILNRCILIVKVPDSRDGGCALCRSKDYSRSGFGQRTVLICDQCEKEYHVGCLKGHGRDDLKEKPQGEWFCCTDCIKIHAALQNLLAHGTRALPDLVSEVIKQKHSDKISNKDGNLELKWRLFRGKTASMSDKLLLSKAVSVLHESFDPIIGGKKGADLVTQMIYGRWWGHMDFQGMYCAILSVDSFVVSVGILRVLGSEAAELPLVATRKESQGQGYFGALFACIGRLLASLNVKHLVLPATQEAEPMWTQRFGFTKISMEQLYELAQGIKIVNFEDTALLHRAVSDLLPTLGSQVS